MLLLPALCLAGWVHTRVWRLSRTSLGPALAQHMEPDVALLKLPLGSLTSPPQSLSSRWTGSEKAAAAQSLRQAVTASPHRLACGDQSEQLVSSAATDRGPRRFGNPATSVPFHRRYCYVHGFSFSPGD